MSYMAYSFLTMVRIILWFSQYWWAWRGLLTCYIEGIGASSPFSVRQTGQESPKKGQ